MFTEFRINLENKPGELARLSTTLGDAGVNIDAIQGMSDNGLTRIQFIAHDPNLASKTLNETDFTYETREVLVVKSLMNQVCSVTSGLSCPRPESTSTQSMLPL